MKLMTTVLALACSSGWLCSAAWAQGNTSRTYFGTNGPQSGQQPGSSHSQSPVPDNFVVNIYGGQNEFAIEVMSPGGDSCGRPFYFTGTVSFQPNQDKGSIGGPMLRCTNPELITACSHPKYYEVGFTGTVERSHDGSRYLIKITYPYTIWGKEDCKQKRETRGTETIMLSYEPPTPPEPTTVEQIVQAEDDAEHKAVDTVYKGVRGGEWLKNRPR